MVSSSVRILGGLRLMRHGQFGDRAALPAQHQVGAAVGRGRGAR